MRAVALVTLTPVLLATALTGPLEVLALVSGYLALRSALIGFMSLVGGASKREIADDMAAAIASGVPSAFLIAAAATVILIGTR